MPGDATKMDRISLKRRRPNPLFQEWLEELYSEAKAKKSKLECKLKVALESLSKYPLPIESGAECAVLQGFDKNLCLFLDRRLEVYYNNNDENLVSSVENAGSGTFSQHKSGVSSSRPVSNTPNTVTIPKTSLESGDNSSLQKQSIVDGKRQPPVLNQNVSKVPKEYKPPCCSASHAILEVLGEDVSEESFTRPYSESFYTAWNIMSRLLCTGLVKQPRSNTYSLSGEDATLAIQLLHENKNTPTVNDDDDRIFNEASSNHSSTFTDMSPFVSSERSACMNNDITNFILKPDTYDIVLLIDKRELKGSSRKKIEDPVLCEFKKYPDLIYEYRSLKVGDFAWVARHKDRIRQEVVLPYIVERKRMDDLGHSIKDGRYHEQKFRLRKCGLQNIIYLVEHCSASDARLGLPLQSLKQALANTRVQDGFKVHFTDSLTTTYSTFIGVDSEPQREQELMTFEYFNRAAIKNKHLTVNETFIKILLQIKGISVEKALAITKEYRTPQALIKRYDSCSTKEGELLLADLKFSTYTNKIGPVASKAIYKFFTWKE